MTPSRFCRTRYLACCVVMLSVLCVLNSIIVLSSSSWANARVTETLAKIPFIRHAPGSRSAKTTGAATQTLTGTETPDRCRPVPERFPRDRPFLPCTWRSDNVTCGHRLRAVLRCSKSSASIVLERVKVGTPPVAVAFNDSCLLRVVRERCSRTGRPVPRVVHYVNFSPPDKRRRPLPVYTFLSLLSAVRFLQPCLLLFHADHLPFGEHWEALLQVTSRVVHVNRTAPAAIFGREIKRIEHKSDVARLEAMRVFGGIYMDTDEWVLQPLDDLLQHHVTMAWEVTNHSLGNGMFLAEPDSPFLNEWYERYRQFTHKQWGYFSTNVPRELYFKDPEKLHVVDTFFWPNLWNIKQLLYERRYDWSNHYALHLYYRRYQAYFRGNFEQGNTTVGEIARHILFGDKTKCR